MLRVLILSILACAVALSPLAAARQPWPADVASYRIEAQLDPETHRIQGEQVLTWRNTSGSTAEEIRLHLYLNAFRNSASTWLKGASARTLELLARDGWGWIEITRLVTADDRDLLGGLEYIAPDDGNIEDRSVARVPLLEPLPPGEELLLFFEFEAQLPRVVARTGFKDDFHLVAQWFPKLGRLEEDGRWSCHQFHASSEFYADFGTYDVSLTLPTGFVVGATGSRVAESLSEDGETQTLRYRQQGVHDFAWTAWPDFVEERRRFEHPGLPAVDLTLLIRPESRKYLDRYAAALEHSLRLFGQWYGPYPYPTLTLVDPPWGARQAGGMEYPTFITAGSRRFSPRATQRPEGVTVHEFGHQYFYGMLASNEALEPFLDEGLTTYATSRVLRKAYGEPAWSFDLWGLPWVFPDVRRQHGLDSGARFFRQPSTDPIARTSWGYLDRGSYGRLTYSKMALLMEQVERTVGATSMEIAMREYVERFRFRHPTAGNLIRTLSWKTGQDLAPMFQQTLYGSGALDYAVSTAKSRPARGPRGTFGEGDARETVERGERLKGYRSEVVVRRLGEVRLPVTVELRFADGEPLRLHWDGQKRWVRYRVRGPHLLSAEVDPDETLVLDVDRLNNSLRTEPDRRASRRWGQRLRFWVQNLLESFVTLA